MSVHSIVALLSVGASVALIVHTPCSGHAV